jgi:hypothetical protein
MDSVFALSVADEVEKYGAYLAVASFIGLAALSILYFSQARELKRLREWAGRAPERAAELQDRVVAEASAAARRVQAQPRPAPPQPVAARPPAAAATAAGAAGATAVPGAAPTAAATTAAATPGAPATPGAGNGVAKPEDPKLGPDGKPLPAEDGAAGTVAPSGDTDGDAKPDDAEKPGGDTEAGVASTPVPAPPAPAAPMAPSTAAARDAAAPAQVPSPAADIPVDLGETTEFDISETDPVDAPPPLPNRRTAPPARAAAAAPLRQSAATASPRRPVAAPAKRGRSSWPVVAGVIAALAVGVFGATQLLGEDEKPAENTPVPADTGNSGNQTETSPGSEDENTGTTSKSERGDITVAVLNGTTTTGLAAKVADKVENAGFARGTTGNNADQQRAASQVFYAEGRRAAAREVAELLGIGEVLPLDVNTRGLAGENAAVVVVVGTDQSTQ